jgi:hypothetical protein
MTIDDLPERLKKKVQYDDATQCWNWTGLLNKDGYGQSGYSLGNSKWKSCTAYKLAYRLLVGEVPQGLQLDHTCRNRLCINPDHLEPVTGKVNTNRGRRSNAEKTHCKHGHEYTDANTGYHDGNRRYCLECAKQRMRTKHVRELYTQLRIKKREAKEQTGASIRKLSHREQMRLYGEIRHELPRQERLDQMRERERLRRNLNRDSGQQK